MSTPHPDFSDFTPDFSDFTPDHRPDLAANPPGVPRPAIPRELQSGQTMTPSGAMSYQQGVASGPNVQAGQAEAAMGFGRPMSETAKSTGQVNAMAVTSAIPALFPPASLLGRVAMSGLASGADTKLSGGTNTQTAIGAGLGAVGQLGGEGLVALMNRVPAAAKFLPRLLNASGQVNPETLANLQAAEPALRAGGPPADTTQAGMAAHVRNLSENIQSKIAPVIEQNAAKDVSATTSQIADDLRAKITPEMQRQNAGTANVIRKTAANIEASTTLKSLDNMRKELNDRVIATKGNAVSKKYLSGALSDVYDAIADHVQEVRPDLSVRAERTQQSALMKLGDIFEKSGVKGQAQAASRAGLTMRQKAGQLLPDVVQGYTNPQAALAKKLTQPSTAEQLIRQAYRSQPAVGSLARSVAPETPGMSSLDMENMNRGGNPAEQAQIQDLMARAKERARGNQYGGTPNATPEQILQQIRQQRPDLFTGQSTPMDTEK